MEKLYQNTFRLAKCTSKDGTRTLFVTRAARYFAIISRMQLKSILAVGVPALLCGALLGYFLHTPPAVEPVKAAPAERTHAKKHARVAPDEEALNRLRARIADLERQLAARDTPAMEEEIPLEPSTNRTDVAKEERRPGPPDFGNFRKKLEELKTTDPDRYARITNHMAQARQRHLERAQSRLDLLASVDTSRMGPNQRVLHAQYQELLAQQEEMRDMMRPENMEQLSDEERKAAFEQMRTIDQQMHRLAKSERNILLQQSALAYGVKGAQAGELVETIKAVYQATESHGGPGGGPGGPGGPRR